ncbi:G-D-S-L family lipolytic protein [Lacihabitans sp. LS3-19]|nr:G-D-S-L family lipolytic protein [Lacihabitans sp. LS3-19]
MPDGNTIAYNVVIPTLSIYLPDKNKATGTAMLIAPGGAFHILSMDSEGHAVAKMLQAKGVASFVLKYRLVQLKTDNPFGELGGKMKDFKKLDEENAPVIELAIKDAQTALKYIRDNATEFEINSDKVGMMGFSAGGTLTLGTFYASSQETKPNFIAPIYPYVPAVDYLKNIPKEKYPIFIALADNDNLGFAPANAQLYLDWHNAGQASEMHIYEKGLHGFGMKKNKIPTDTWHERLTDWMKLQGYLKKKHPQPWEVGKTDEQLEAEAKKNAEREQRDWTNLGRYRDANAKIGAPKSGKTRVVLTGDSITDGWAYASPDFFEKNNYVGRGISGQTSPQTLLRFRQDVIDLKPKAVVINIGINDIAENTGDYMPEFTLGNYRSMIEIAKANNIKVILASVLPAYQFPWRMEITDVPAKVIALNEGIKKLAKEYNVTYLDYFNALKDERNGLSKEMAGDGVHPTKECYAIMEKMVKGAIDKTLGK